MKVDVFHNLNLIGTAEGVKLDFNAYEVVMPVAEMWLKIIDQTIYKAASKHGVITVEMDKEQQKEAIKQRLTIVGDSLATENLFLDIDSQNKVIAQWDNKKFVTYIAE